ncbi:hypothetical protein [Pedobacter duraquae]|uniref:Uncharacterized protein n=1 Tax=Pedobacter duraquae TaxID=425511 RepID=A0A4V3C3K8_9SPHI|nr:hypothetical protein [Pedobacter duraquae]TDO22458.1 hypothetical protein CLV32_1431 [Pedobacter duraquae]
MDTRYVEAYNLLKNDYENKKKNTATARASLSLNPGNTWLIENLNNCISAESLALTLLENHGNRGVTSGISM